MSLPNYIPYAARKAVSKHWHEAKAKKRMERGPDADTLRKRALYDARGKLVAEGCTYTATGAHAWFVRRAIGGRTNQYELVVNGRLRDRCGRRKLKTEYHIVLSCK